MKKVFLLTLCLFLLPPVIAGELSDEIFTENLQELPAQPTAEEIFLFSQEFYNDDNNPYKTYDGKSKNQRQTLKGGVKFRDKQSMETILSNDGTEVTLKPAKKKAGTIHFENISSGSNSGASIAFKKDKFGIKSSFTRNEFVQELATNAISISPEYRLNKHLTLRATYNDVAEKKGYTNGMTLEYAIRNNKSKLQKLNNLKFEINASSTINSRNDATNRFGLRTRYDF